ncbi:YitT family protein [Anaerosacchariphilus sp. NSJ-68]|uniref:YitT family protein n=2 Tax=Lachnospiraceae TaxID=186803 RepID=A0A923LA35_9FIRM|nr:MULTISPECIES: YitT family protein [Lachnospiraceae]MBC5658513.1 YitT family protein [Anaerosacchariphilus hominis]MBC5698278.1 YitT family protein [Roseburia difficilis]
MSRFKIHITRNTLKNYLFMVVGTALMAFSIASVFDPVSLITGGFSGLSIIVRQLTEPLVPGGIPLSVTNLALNIPFLLLTVKLKGFRYLLRTGFATVALSFWLSVLPVIPIAEGDLLLSALYGGLFMGAGIGLVFVAQSTTGGTDLIAALIQHFLPSYSISTLMWILDTLIVLLGAYLFGIQMTLYAIIAIYLTSHVADGLIEGLKFSKAAFIITGKPDELSATLMQELDRGVTGISAMGMYSREAKNMLLCVVARKQIVQLKELAKECDPGAFVIVTDVREVLGEGFIER